MQDCRQPSDKTHFSYHKSKSCQKCNTFVVSVYFTFSKSYFKIFHCFTPPSPADLFCFEICFSCLLPWSALPMVLSHKKLYAKKVIITNTAESNRERVMLTHSPLTCGTEKKGAPDIAGYRRYQGPRAESWCQHDTASMLDAQHG